MKIEDDGGRDAKQCGIRDLLCLRRTYESEHCYVGDQQGEGVRADVDGGKHNSAVDNEQHGRDESYFPGQQLPRTPIENVCSREHSEDRRNPQHNFLAPEDCVREPQYVEVCGEGVSFYGSCPDLPEAARNTPIGDGFVQPQRCPDRSEEHTSELQSLRHLV